MPSSQSCRLGLASLLSLLMIGAAGAEQAIQDCPECPRVLPLAAGKFIMGDDNNASLMPVHRVEISYRFALGETEVTRAQFRYFVQRTGYVDGIIDDAAGEARLPATGVDWFAARAYTRWLSRHTGQRYRLPTEAEWEYAARAGTRSRYWWGNEAAAACGNERVAPLFYGIYSGEPCELDGAVGLIAVASLRANPWGLYDMLGNADEWMADCPPAGTIGYDGAPSDGAPFFAKCTYFDAARVVRRVANYDGAIGRDKLDPLSQSTTVGFRVVRELP
jgi:formylglycine-generating enzyme required for sulfatase activity